jgi:hypothetical protein
MRSAFLALLILAPTVIYSQANIKPEDSIAIKRNIEGFYSWYIDVIKGQKIDSAFRPVFVRRPDGMTTLYFKAYNNGLRKYKFTKEFIQRKTSEYRECLDNLNKMPFEEFSKLKDLDEFERIRCEFGNTYEWTGGMESKDTASLSSLKFIDKKTIIGHVDFTSNGSPDGHVLVTFKKVEREWRVDDIQ